MQLMRQFREDGHAVEAAFVAWSGPIRPGNGGYSGWALLLVRHRALAVVGGRLEVWTTWSGRPSSLLAEAPVAELVWLRRGWRYDRIAIAGRKLWTVAKQRQDLERVVAASGSTP